MATVAEFDRYMAYLCEGLGHADRHQSLLDYCSGLMLPIERKSVEPLAAHAAPQNVRAKHQSLHHFVANSGWSDPVLLERVRAWVEPHLGIRSGTYWIIDDTGHPKCGTQSVGVARQYCGVLGKRDNCQVAVSLSLASARGSVPIDYQLYVPQEWFSDAKRRGAVGIPEDLQFATKPQMALAQICRAHARGVVPGIVLADADYGRDRSLRDGVAALGLQYAVAVRADTTVRRAPGQRVVRVEHLAKQLKRSEWRTVTWREGSNAKLSSRFARARVRVGERDEEWLLIEWPVGEPEPTRYFLSNLPAKMPLRSLVNAVKMRWRIEHDYHELKQEFGLSHYEGRGWRGFHHHASLCIAAYGFLTADRLKQHSKKNCARPKAPLLPDTYEPRGSRPRATPCSGFDSDAAPSHLHADRAAP